MVVVFGIVWLISRNMGQVNLNRVTLAIVVAMLMLSLVPLTGWAGQVSLAQITFAGAGAFAMYQWAPFGSGSPVGLLIAAAFACPFGFLMCLPGPSPPGSVPRAGVVGVRAHGGIAVLRPTRGLRQRSRNPSRGFASSATGSPTARLPAARHCDLRRHGDRRGLAAPRALRPPARRAPRQRSRVRHARREPLPDQARGVRLSAAMAGFAGALLGMQRGTAATQDFALLSPLAIPIVLLDRRGRRRDRERCADRRDHCTSSSW